MARSTCPVLPGSSGASTLEFSVRIMCWNCAAGVAWSTPRSSASARVSLSCLPWSVVVGGGEGGMVDADGGKGGRGAGPRRNVITQCLVRRQTPCLHLLQARHVAVVGLRHQVPRLDLGEGCQVLQHRHVHGGGHGLHIVTQAGELGAGRPGPQGHAAGAPGWRLVRSMWWGWLWMRRCISFYWGEGMAGDIEEGTGVCDRGLRLTQASVHRGVC